MEPEKKILNELAMLRLGKMVLQIQEEREARHRDLDFKETILRTFVRKGESQYDAIVRISVLAGQLGAQGYCIHCERCGQPIDKHTDLCPDAKSLGLFFLDNKGAFVE